MSISSVSDQFLPATPSRPRWEKRWNFATQPGLYDCANWGRLVIRGQDRLRFLHNQSSNNLNIQQPGQVCDTVILTATARILDLVTAWIKPDEILLLVSPQRRELLLKWLDNYIFFGDKVELQDGSEALGAWRVIGPGAGQLLSQWGLEPELLEQPDRYGTLELEAGSVLVSGGCGLGLPGITLVTTPSVWASFAPSWEPLTQPITELDWEHLRILQGRPAVDAELTEDYNPLEARLDYTISFDKGCYIGQETIARLNTYQGVKQHLWGLVLGDWVEPGTPLMLEETKVGVVTSCTMLSQADGPENYAPKAFGLGYVKTKAGGVGLKLQAGDILAEVVAVPFLDTGVVDA